MGQCTSKKTSNSRIVVTPPRTRTNSRPQNRERVNVTKKNESNRRSSSKIDIDDTVIPVFIPLSDSTPTPTPHIIECHKHTPCHTSSHHTSSNYEVTYDLSHKPGNYEVTYDLSHKPSNYEVTYLYDHNSSNNCGNHDSSSNYGGNCDTSYT